MWMASIQTAQRSDAGFSRPSHSWRKPRACRPAPVHTDRPSPVLSLSYDAAWLNNPRAFAVQPDFPLEAGTFHTSGQAGNSRDALPGAFADAAPESWGRRLLERAYGNGLTEFEYLTLSDDTCRQGALRFLDDAGRIIRGGAADAAPRLVDLQAITAIARAYEQGKDISAQDLQALAGAGGSGGRARRQMSEMGTRFGLPSSPRCTTSSRSSVSRWRH